MTITMHRIFTSNFLPILDAMRGIIDNGMEHAARTDQDLVHAKLAPDMYDFATQIREICHYAKDGASRLSGGEPVSKEAVGVRDNFGAIRSQVDSAIAFIESVPAAKFEGSETRDLSIHMRDGKRIMEMDGWRYLNGWLLPQFYFHAVTAYDILRSHGVPLVKLDYEKQVKSFIKNK